MPACRTRRARRGSKDSSLALLGPQTSGVLRLTPAGLVWRRKQGSKTVEVKKEEVDGLSWTKVPRGCQLSVRRRQDASVNFLGFRDKVRAFEALFSCRWLQSADSQAPSPDGDIRRPHTRAAPLCVAWRASIVSIHAQHTQDLEVLQSYARGTLGLSGVSEEPLSTSGHNWGSLALQGKRWPPAQLPLRSRALAVLCLQGQS
jgi:hypothetical protein